MLASASPRRRELLRLLGVAFRVEPLEVDETRLPGEDPVVYARRLAEDKARAGRERHPAAPVLAADTVVARGDAVLGKPGGRDEALAMLAKLSGDSHWVYTAVALHTPAGRHSTLSASLVSFREIDAVEAQAYWDTGEPADKAGAYAIQGCGAVFVRRIEGSHSGVVGLPLVETLELLRSAGVSAAPCREALS